MYYLYPKDELQPVTMFNLVLVFFLSFLLYSHFFLLILVYSLFLFHLHTILPRNMSTCRKLCALLIAMSNIVSIHLLCIYLCANIFAIPFGFLCQCYQLLFKRNKTFQCLFYNMIFLYKNLYEILEWYYISFFLVLLLCFACDLILFSFSCGHF